MTESRPTHRKCENCDLHIHESTLRELAETSGPEAEYQRDMKAYCPRCLVVMTRMYTKVPSDAQVFEPRARQGVGEDTRRETREKIFGGDRVHGVA